MAIGSITSKLTTLVLIGSFGMTACSSNTSNGSDAQVGQASDFVGAEADLRQQSAALSRTILEGAVAGAGAGAAFGAARGNKNAINAGIKFGLFAGAAAGTYVGFVQKKYSNKEKQLRLIKSDLDENAVEIQTTIIVMREVLAVQKAELSNARAALNSGTGTSGQLQNEIASAQANLVEMQRAINGANARHAEFNQTRGLTPVSGGGSAIDSDLASLSQQIALMKAVADDLAKEI